MKKHSSIIISIAFIAMLFFLQNAKAQTTKTLGGSGANYSTLKQAFDAINSGAITGNIILQITGSTIETTYAMLNASGSGSASYTSVKIYPTASGYSISGNLSSSLFELNGADNVTLDGRVNQTGSTPDLTLSNTSTYNTSSRTILFENGASSNTIKYCFLKGASTGTTGAIIYFLTAGATGNSNNIIDHCNITNSGSRPTNAIYSQGTTGLENSGNIISNNNFYDFFSPTSNSVGIFVNGANINWTISGNSFYETTAFVPSNAFTYKAININNPSGNSFVISGNYIGGSQPNCGGQAMNINSNYPHIFQAIYLSVGSSLATTVQSNIIRNINYSSVSANPWYGIYINSGATDIGTYAGNIIGDSTGNNSIIISNNTASGSANIVSGSVSTVTVVNGGSGFTSAPAITFSGGGGSGASATAVISGGSVVAINMISGGSGYTSGPTVSFNSSASVSISYGILITSGNTVNILNNKIGSVTTTGSLSFSHGFYGIYKRSSGGNTTIQNNLIGSSVTANSIQASSLSNSQIAQSVYGIISSGTGNVNIINNTISNLLDNYSYIYSTNGQIAGIITSAGNNIIQKNIIRNLTSPNQSNDPDEDAAIIGISQTSNSSGQTITGNTISGLNSTYTGTRPVSVLGIYYIGANNGTNSISNNFIHSFSIISTASLANPAQMTGMRINEGKVVMANNIVNLGTSMSNGCSIMGIFVNGTPANKVSIWFNTIYIGGSTTGVTASTYAFYNLAKTNGMDLQNNILFNARSGGISGNHYSFYFADIANLNSNYNDYFVSGTNAILGKEASTNLTTLTAIRNTTNSDANSLNNNPGFLGAGGTSAQSYYTTATLPAWNGSGITTDYFGSVRSSSPKMGALESRSYTWKGAVSANFATAANWLENVVPNSGDNVIFNASPNNNCVLDQSRTVGFITNQQGVYNFITNGFKLTVNGNFNFSNGAKLDASSIGSTVEFAGILPQSIASGAFANNKVYNLIINNSSNVTLSGSLLLMNSFTAPSGHLDAFTNNPSVIYSGLAAQTIDTNCFLSNKVYNLTIDNASGVTLRSNLTINNNLLINSGKLFNVAPSEGLTVLGTLTNNADSSGFILQSDATGTASLIHNTNNVRATVKRYISGHVEDWHFLSTPVSNQRIAGDWLPSGTYGNGTGYDLYIYNEPSNCWVYFLNHSGNPNWLTEHPSSYFMSGKGYLYSFQADKPTKQFIGKLFNGDIIMPLTNNCIIDTLKGFNFLGNPYPSSIDWQATTGWMRNNLILTGGGYDMWIWNPLANNYGVINTTDADGIGTNSVSRYIPPMQGFFVRAAGNNSISMSNAVRVHNGANNWKKIENADKIKLHVDSHSGNGFDESILQFAWTDNEAGALKLFSQNTPAPSLYMPYGDNLLSIRYFTNTTDNPSVPLSFKAGSDDDFTLSVDYDPTHFPVVMLEDKKLRYIYNLRNNNQYNFKASTSDNSDRFNILFSPDTNRTVDLPAGIYCDGNSMVIDLSLVVEQTHVLIYDVLGRLLVNQYLDGLTIHKIPLNVKFNVLFVRATTDKSAVTRVVLNY